jgi:transposase-like protein
MKKTGTAVGRKGQKGRSFKFDLAFRRKVSQDYNNGSESLKQVAARYDINFRNVQRWSKEFSSELSEEETTIVMTEQEQKELEALKKQNKQLKEKLDYEQMRTFALETMIDLAKEKLGVDVRKNFGAKQPEE